MTGDRGHWKGQLRVLGSPSALHTKEPRTGGAPGGRGVRGPDFFLRKSLRTYLRVLKPDCRPPGPIGNILATCWCLVLSVVIRYWALGYLPYSPSPTHPGGGGLLLLTAEPRRSPRGGLGPSRPKTSAPWGVQAGLALAPIAYNIIFLDATICTCRSVETFASTVSAESDSVLPFIAFRNSPHAATMIGTKLS